MGISKRQEEIVKQTLRHAVVAVRTIPNSALAEFLPRLRHAQAELTRELKLWELKQDGSKRYTAHVKRSALVQIDAAIQEVENLGGAMHNTLMVSGVAAGEAGLTAMQQQLTSLNAMFKGAMVPVSIERAAILNKGERALIKKYPSSAARYAGNIRKDIMGRLSVGVLQQKTISQMANQMFKDIPQVFNTAKFNAMRLVRTEVMNSYNDMHHEGLLDAHEEDSDVKMRWDASYDHRRCPECGALDGKIVAVDGEFVATWKTASGSPRGSTNKRPPAHAQCRCVLVPWIDSWPDSDWNTEPPGMGKPAPDATRIFGRGVRPDPYTQRQTKQARAKIKSQLKQLSAAKTHAGADKIYNEIAVQERILSRAQRAMALEVKAKKDPSG